MDIAPSVHFYVKILVHCKRIHSSLHHFAQCQIMWYTKVTEKYVETEGQRMKNIFKKICNVSVNILITRLHKL